MALSAKSIVRGAFRKKSRAKELYQSEERKEFLDGIIRETIIKSRRGKLDFLIGRYDEEGNPISSKKLTYKGMVLRIVDNITLLGSPTVIIEVRKKNSLEKRWIAVSLLVPYRLSYADVVPYGSQWGYLSDFEVSPKFYVKKAQEEVEVAVSNLNALTIKASQI